MILIYRISMHRKKLLFFSKNYYQYYDLALHRASARSFPRPISPKICHIFGKICEYKFSLCEYKLSLCFLSLLLGGRNFITFLGKFLFSPVRVPLSNCSTVGRGRLGVRFPPGPLSLGIQLCLSMCLLSFPQICHNFRAFTRAQFSQKYPIILGLFTIFFRNTNFGNFRFALPLF